MVIIFFDVGLLIAVVLFFLVCLILGGSETIIELVQSNFSLIILILFALTLIASIFIIRKFERGLLTTTLLSVLLSIVMDIPLFIFVFDVGLIDLSSHGLWTLIEFILGAVVYAVLVAIYGLVFGGLFLMAMIYVDEARNEFLANIFIVFVALTELIISCLIMKYLFVKFYQEDLRTVYTRFSPFWQAFFAQMIS